MKNNTQNRLNGHSNDRAVRLVQLKFTHPTARAVAIAGSFNDWKPEATPMVSLGEGHWAKDLVLPPGSYEYLFVADGQWLADPMARETVANPFGGMNSVINVEENPGRVLARVRTGTSSKPAKRPLTHVAHG